MSNQINVGKSLTDVIKENSSLFAAMGVLAAVAGFFLGRTDISNLITKDIPSVINFLYFSISSLSYFEVLLLSREVIKNVLTIEKSKLEVKSFVYLLIGITVSLNIVVILTALDTFLKATPSQQIFAVFDLFLLFILIQLFLIFYRKIDLLLVKMHK